MEHEDFPASRLLQQQLASHPSARDLKTWIGSILPSTILMPKDGSRTSEREEVATCLVRYSWLKSCPSPVCCTALGNGLPSYAIEKVDVADD